MTQHVLKYTIQTLILGAALMFALSVGYLNAAWSNPGAGTVPTGNNAPTPINVSGTAQTKSGSLTLGGDITVQGGDVFFAGGQRFRGDGVTALQYYSNDNDYSQMIFRDKQGKVYGRVYGNGDGASFGLLDGDGSWSYRAIKDNRTEFRINNATVMTLDTVGGGRVRANAYCDINGANCNTPTKIFTTCSSADTRNSSNVACYQAGRMLRNGRYRAISCQYGSGNYNVAMYVRFYANNRWLWVDHKGNWYDCVNGTTLVVDTSA